MKVTTDEMLVKAYAYKWLDPDKFDLDELVMMLKVNRSSLNKDLKGYDAQRKGIFNKTTKDLINAFTKTEKSVLDIWLKEAEMAWLEKQELIRSITGFIHTGSF